MPIRVEQVHQETEGAVEHGDVAGSYQLLQQQQQQQQQQLRQASEKRTTLPQQQPVKWLTTSELFTV